MWWACRSRRKLSKKIELERDSVHAYGFTPKPWFAKIKETWNFMMNKMTSVTEAVNGAWEILCEDHERIAPNSIQLQE